MLRVGFSSRIMCYLASISHICLMTFQTRPSSPPIGPVLDTIRMVSVAQGLSSLTGIWHKDMNLAPTYRSKPTESMKWSIGPYVYWRSGTI